MAESPLPPALQQVFDQTEDPATLLAALLPVLGECLGCDRCFFYLRHPETCVGRVPFCWCREPQFPVIQDPDWKVEPASLPEEDPLFAAALRAEPTIYVEDVETAGAAVLNRQFEQENFGHRALIHAPLCQDGQLWGILEPCVFDHPRIWTMAERETIRELEQRLAPLVVAYVQTDYRRDSARSSRSE